MGRLRRVAVAVGVSALVLAGISGCTYITDALAQKRTLTENLENQRISAQKFISNWPTVEIIEFTREGSIDGSGEWSTNAIVTIEGKTYAEIIGPWETVGDDLPGPPDSFSPQAVTVKYSDGTSEVLG
ncbi:hypothetical protein AB4Z18_03240 [Leifsonia sp. 2TAF2]|uniref:hypothetical protein n=1 Tax=Leifsonia sp. 2TAF2 TaxID=3233009 RepID=UPI003F958FE5